jgi:predicted amidophosphoribosyltransferase
MTGLPHRFAVGGRALLDLVVDLRCPGCGALPTLGAGCAACAAAWAAPRLDRLDGIPLASCGPYAGPVRASVLAYKEAAGRRLAGELGGRLAVAVRALPALPVPLLLVPVPASPAARRRRGHDHGVSLARAAAAALRRGGTPAAVLPALRLTRRVADSAPLNRAERAANLAGAFGLRRGAVAAGAGAAVVLVDDVVTTGATVREALAALVSGGGDVAGVVCLAGPRPRHAGAPVGPPEILV